MPGQIGNKGGGRKGYNFENIINKSIEIVENEFKIDKKKIWTPKEKANAALELVKKALPTNVNLGGRLEIMFNEVFKSARKPKEDSSE